MAANGANAETLRKGLNRMSSPARAAALGDVVYDIINKHNALCAALDAANMAGMGTTALATFGVKLPDQR